MTSLPGDGSRFALSPARRALFGSISAGVAGQVFLVASGVIAARVLGPTDRGYLALIVLIPAIVSQLGSFGLAAGTTYFIAKNPPGVRAIMNRLRPLITLQICVLTAIHVVVLLIVVSGEPSRVRDAGLLTLVLMTTGFTQEYVLAILQGCRTFLAFNLLRLAPGALYAAGLVGLYVVGEASLVTIVLVMVGTNMFTAAVGVLVAVRRSRVTTRSVSEDSIPSRSELARFGLKGYLGASSPIEALRVDQAIVALFISPTALGLYVVALALTNLPRFVGQSIGLVAYPYVAHQPDAAAARRSVWRYAALCAGISTPLVLILVLAANDLVPFFFGESFAEAAGSSRILMLAALLIAVRRVLADGARGLGRPLLGTFAEVVTWLVFILALAFLPPSDPEDVARAMVLASGAGLALIAIQLVRSSARRAGGKAVAQTPPAAQVKE